MPWPSMAHVLSVKPSALTGHTWLQRISPMHLRHRHIASKNQLTGCGLIDGLKWCDIATGHCQREMTPRSIMNHWDLLGSIGIDWDYHLVMAPFGSSWVPATLNLSRTWIAWIAWIGEGLTQLVALPDKDSCESFRQLTTVQHGATRCNTVQHGATRCNTVQHGEIASNRTLDALELCGAHGAICPATPLQRGSHLHKHGSPAPSTLVHCYPPAHIISHHLIDHQFCPVWSHVIPYSPRSFSSKPLQNEAPTGWSSQSQRVGSFAMELDSHGFALHRGAQLFHYLLHDYIMIIYNITLYTYVYIIYIYIHQIHNSNSKNMFKEQTTWHSLSQFHSPHLVPKGCGNRMSCRPLLRNVARQVGVLQLELQRALLAFYEALKVRFQHFSNFVKYIFNMFKYVQIVRLQNASGSTGSLSLSLSLLVPGLPPSQHHLSICWKCPIVFATANAISD